MSQLGKLFEVNPTRCASPSCGVLLAATGSHARGGGMKKLRCALGFHHWVTYVTEGESYLKCRDCGKYGGSPGSFSAGWGYKK